MQQLAFLYLQFDRAECIGPMCCTLTALDGYIAWHIIGKVRHDLQRRRSKQWGRPRVRTEAQMDKWWGLTAVQCQCICLVGLNGNCFTG